MIFSRQLSRLLWPLQDGVVDAIDVGDNGSTGFVDVNLGSHTVGESAGTGTSLSNY
jgi:hypothetical protein